MRRKNLLFVLFLVSFAQAQDLKYHLPDIRPLSFSVYKVASTSVRRQYLRLHNQDGNHYIVYEEDSGHPPIKEFTDLKDAAQNWNST